MEIGASRCQRVLEQMEERILNLRKSWTQKNSNFCVEDLVIISSHNVPRSYWPIRCIIEVHPGRDGVVHSVKLKTSNGELSWLSVLLCLLVVQQINQIHFSFGRGEFVLSKHNNF